MSVLENDTDYINSDEEYKPVEVRIGNAVSDFSIDLEEYCKHHNLLICESLRYNDIYHFLLSILD